MGDMFNVSFSIKHSIINVPQSYTMKHSSNKAGDDINLAFEIITGRCIRKWYLAVHCQLLFSTCHLIITFNPRWYHFFEKWSTEEVELTARTVVIFDAFKCKRSWQNYSTMLSSDILHGVFWPRYNHSGLSDSRLFAIYIHIHVFPSEFKNASYLIHHGYWVCFLTILEKRTIL